MKKSFTIRLEEYQIKAIQSIAPEGNVSMWIRSIINEKLKGEMKMRENYYEKLVKEASKYTDYETFRAEIGWQDWMEEYTESEEGEPVTESEGNKIEKILREAFSRSEELKGEIKMGKEKRFVKMNSSDEEIRKICGDVTYCATIDGCIDDKYFDTLEEAKTFAQSQSKNVLISKLVWDSENGEYIYNEV